MRHRGRHCIRTATLPRGHQLGARLSQCLLEHTDLKQLLLCTLRGQLARLCRAGRKISVREIWCISCISGREIAVPHARHGGGVARAAQLACGAQQWQCREGVEVDPERPAQSIGVSAVCRESTQLVLVQV